MKDTYFLIRNSDGDTTVREITKAELLEGIDEREYDNFLSRIPENNDTNYWGEGVLVIKGHIVTPTVKQVATQYDIE